jgi:choline-sulfatase
VQPDVPWFVCAGYSRPHPPFTAPGRYIRRYQGKAPAPRVPAQEREHLEPHARAMADRYSHMAPDVAMSGRDGYYACVDFVDDCIGELLDGLARDGMLDNTIVIYTSDHGEMLGEHGIWGKTMYFEPAVAVPLLMSGPGIVPGRRVSAPISLIDLFPTTAALAGLPIPDGLDGVNFSAFLAAPETTPAPRDYAPSAYYRYGVLVDLKKNPIRADQPNEAWRSLRDARYKYVEVEGGASLLFDVVADPGELRNLVGLPEYVARCQSMRAALYRDFTWDAARRQLALDRAQLPAFKSGMQPSTPNQYMLPDGRTFDAESALYGARWLQLPDDTSGGIIPQQFG